MARSRRNPSVIRIVLASAVTICCRDRSPAVKAVSVAAGGFRRAVSQGLPRFPPTSYDGPPLGRSCARRAADGARRAWVERSDNDIARKAAAALAQRPGFPADLPIEVERRILEPG